MVSKIKGVTLAEILIAVVLTTLIFFVLQGTNLVMQITKTKDLRRKDHFNKMQKVVEDFNVDHGRYPSVEEMAYEPMNDTSQNLSQALAGKVCGKRKTSSIIQQYLGELPCDSRSPDTDYVYFLFENGQKYALYANLENLTDPIISEIGCATGCSYHLDMEDPAGSVSNHYFNYYVASSDFNVADCEGSGNIIACYPNRREVNDRCISCPGGNCLPGYATLYCNPNWCLEKCK